MVIVGQMGKLYRKKGTAPVYWAHDNRLMAIPSETVLKAVFGPDAWTVVNDVDELPFPVYGQLEEGTCLVRDQKGGIYLATGNRLCWIASPDVMNWCHFDWNGWTQIPAGLNQLLTILANNGAIGEPILYTQDNH